MLKNKFNGAKMALVFSVLVFSSVSHAQEGLNAGEVKAGGKAFWQFVEECKSGDICQKVRKFCSETFCIAPKAGQDDSEVEAAMQKHLADTQSATESTTAFAAEQQKAAKAIQSVSMKSGDSNIVFVQKAGQKFVKAVSDRSAAALNKMESAFQKVGDVNFIEAKDPSAIADNEKVMIDAGVDPKTGAIRKITAWINKKTGNLFANKANEDAINSVLEEKTSACKGDPKCLADLDSKEQAYASCVLRNKYVLPAAAAAAAAGTATVTGVIMNNSAHSNSLPSSLPANNNQ